MRQKWVLACQSFGEYAVRVKLELTDFSFAHDDSEWKKKCYFDWKIVVILWICSACKMIYLFPRLR